MADFLYRDDGLTVDFRSCRVWVDDEEIQTTAIRFRILSLLIENAGRPLGANEIMQHAWQGEDYDLGLVRWHIARLRKELGDSPPKRIVHVRGFGYRFDVSEPAPETSRSSQLGRERSNLRKLVARPFRRCFPSSSAASHDGITPRAVRCLR